SSPKMTVRKVITIVAIIMLISSLPLNIFIANAVPTDVARIVNKFPERITALKRRSCCSRIFWAIPALLLPFSARCLNLILFTAINATSATESKAIRTRQKIMIKKLIESGIIGF
ncbi:MAG: hypothetical protein AAB089_02690, partial [Nitrospirota bacterium]